MIELGFERRDDGAYFLDPKIIEDNYTVTFNSNEVTGEHLDNNFWLDNGKVMVLAKTIPSWSKTYMMSIFGELLFSKFALKNQIPCAEIDVGYYDGLYYTLSKSVMGQGEEKLSLRDLRRLCKKEDDYRLATISETVSLLREYCALTGARIAPNCFFKLKVVALGDYLVAQRDRNITNMIFAVKDTPFGKEIDVKPVIDNENSFSFVYLLHRYNEKDLPQASFLYKSEKGRRRINKLVSKAKIVGKDFSLPIFGVKSNPMFDWEALGIKDFFGELFKGTETKKYKDKICYELAEDIRKDKRLFNLFKNITFDAKQCGEEITNETGVVIPKAYLSLAQEVVDSRINDLWVALDKQIQSEMGE